MKQDIKNIVIGGIIYPVIYKDVVICDGEESCGAFDFVKSEIEISNRQSDICFCKTLLHEIIHAIEKEYGIELSETQTDCLAGAFLGLMLHNRHIFKHIFEVLSIEEDKYYADSNRKTNGTP